MNGTFVTDMTHFLTEAGAIAPESGPARRFAEFLASLVSSASSFDEGDQPVTQVSCRRRPGRKRCAGKIETDIDPDTDAIVWFCPVCGDNGIIRNWQGTLWDRSLDGEGH